MFGYVIIGGILLAVSIVVIFLLEPIQFWWRKTASDIANEPIHRQKVKDHEKLRRMINPLTKAPTRDFDPAIEELISEDRFDEARAMTAERLKAAISEDREILTSLYRKYQAKLGSVKEDETEPD